jgi:uncharacterized membrane protein YoaK (UPF0700 family)
MRTTNMTKIGSAVLALTLMTGCAGTIDPQKMTDQQKKEAAEESLSGGAVGASGGAVIGAIAGSAVVGAAILGPIGLVAGLAYYDYEQSKKKSKNGQSKEK